MDVQAGCECCSVFSRFSTHFYQLYICVLKDCIIFVSCVLQLYNVKQSSVFVLLLRSLSITPPAPSSCSLLLLLLLPTPSSCSFLLLPRPVPVSVSCSLFLLPSLLSHPVPSPCFCSRMPDVSMVMLCTNDTVMSFVEIKSNDRC